MSEDKEQTCKECRYYLSYESIPEFDLMGDAMRQFEKMGICRRYPEHVKKREFDWCGEFKQK